MTNLKPAIGHERERLLASFFSSCNYSSRSLSATTTPRGKHHRNNKDNVNSARPNRPRNDRTYESCTKLTQTLLQEKDFTKWDHLIVAITNRRNANIDTLLRDYWGQYLEKRPQLDDVILFSNLCLRILEQSSSSGLKLRVVQQALVAWTRVAQYDSSEAVLRHARQLFDAIPPPPKDYQNRRSTDLKDRKGLYRLMFLVYSRSHHPDAVTRCHALLEQLLREDQTMTKPPESHPRGGKQPQQPKIPDPHDRGGQRNDTIVSQTAFHWTLRAAAKMGNDALWHSVRARMHQEGWDDTAITYDCLLQLLQTIEAQQGSDNHHVRQNIKQEALRSWQQLLQHYQQNPSPQWQPLPATLGKVLLFHKDDPQQSLQILTDAILFVKDYPTCQSMVDGPVLRLILLTMVKHSRPAEADRIGRYMMEAYNRGNAALKLMSDHFCLLIRVHLEAGDFKQAKEYVEWMEASGPGDLPTYNLYLRGLLEHQEDPVPDMEAIMERMSRPSEGQFEVAPNLTTYLTLMNGWVKSKRPGYVQKVDEIFRAAQVSMKSHGETSDEIYGVVIHAWARSRLPEAADRCRDIWKEIPAPTLVHYNILMKAYALSRLPEEAEALFREILNKANMQIDHISFNTVILAWSIAGNTNRALALVDLMVSKNPQADFLRVATIDSILR
eukprot:scaffold42721_cov191-Amphora_coffeaeformis.AAC.1